MIILPITSSFVDGSQSPPKSNFIMIAERRVQDDAPIFTLVNDDTLNHPQAPIETPSQDHEGKEGRKEGRKEDMQPPTQLLDKGQTTRAQACVHQKKTMRRKYPAQPRGERKDGDRLVPYRDNGQTGSVSQTTSLWSRSGTRWPTAVAEGLLRFPPSGHNDSSVAFTGLAMPREWLQAPFGIGLGRLIGMQAREAEFGIRAPETTASSLLLGSDWHRLWRSDNSTRLGFQIRWRTMDADASRHGLGVGGGGGGSEGERYSGANSGGKSLGKGWGSDLVRILLLGATIR
ncbi:hypothetical protein AXG93_1409s1040 [Marchantia polymorpha subsp. ruderalis]|uniref:Uncharacterized protein n=1 Tax=Marchantia polymorpha subsp. ruderalis TaxID=1480154 RepID=A0A176WI87_MARPO|nr:hypothetical protein AXG93_1409s1040 [Marchantia polymorpha subsp. ruderalis]